VATPSRDRRDLSCPAKEVLRASTQPFRGRAFGEADEEVVELREFEFASEIDMHGARILLPS
jgi:hypothetical protein